MPRRAPSGGEYIPTLVTFTTYIVLWLFASVLRSCETDLRTSSTNLRTRRGGISSDPLTRQCMSFPLMSRADKIDGVLLRGVQLSGFVSLVFKFGETYQDLNSEEP